MKDFMGRIELYARHGLWFARALRLPGSDCCAVRDPGRVLFERSIGYYPELPFEDALRVARLDYPDALVELAPMRFYFAVNYNRSPWIELTERQFDATLQRLDGRSFAKLFIEALEEGVVEACSRGGYGFRLVWEGKE